MHKSADENTEVKHWHGKMATKH